MNGLKFNLRWDSVGAVLGLFAVTVVAFATVMTNATPTRQTLPSSFQISEGEDIQSFAPGTEFPLSAEAAKLKTAKN